MYALANLNDGLVAYWSFDDCSAKDNSGNNNNGTQNGTQCVQGQIGQALSFNGISDYVEIPASNSLDTRYSNSMFAWINPHGNYGPIFNYCINCWGIHLWQTSNQTPSKELFSRYVARNGYMSQHLQVSVLEKDKWHFVGTTYDANTGLAKLYDNGIKVQEINLGKIELATQYPIRMGLRNGDSRIFNGLIDEARIYNRALTDTEIQELYAQGTPPEITSINPTKAIIGKETIFEVHGHNLTPTMGFTIGDCAYSNTALIGGTSELQKFICTPYGKTGNKRGLIKNKIGGDTLYNFTIKAVNNTNSPDDAVITGTIQIGSQKASNILLVSNDDTSRCVTDNNGIYRCTIPNNWSGVLQPQAKDIQFNPAIISIQNYNGQIPPTIIGTPTDSFPLNGVIPNGWKKTANTSAWQTVLSNGEDDNISYEGRVSLRPAKLKANQTSGIETTITTDQISEISFARRVSSNENHGLFNFYIDDVLINTESGELAWQIKRYSLNAGTHTLRWVYTKDAEISKGEDTVWLDAVNYYSVQTTAKQISCKGITQGTLNLMKVENKNPSCQQAQAFSAWLKHTEMIILSNGDIFKNTIEGVDTSHEFAKKIIESVAVTADHILAFKGKTAGELILKNDVQLKKDLSTFSCHVLFKGDDEGCQKTTAAVFAIVDFGVEKVLEGTVEPMMTYPYAIENLSNSFVDFFSARIITGETASLNSVNIAVFFLDEYYKAGIDKNFAKMKTKYNVSQNASLSELIDAFAVKKGYGQYSLFGIDYVNDYVIDYINDARTMTNQFVVDTYL